MDASGKALDTEDLKFKLNEFDDHALEEAILLKESGSADEVVAVAVEGEGADRMLFTAIAKGADKAIKLTGGNPVDSINCACVCQRSRIGGIRLGLFRRSVCG